jgi:predicted alpha/beta superfamily hydrolase
VRLQKALYGCVESSSLWYQNLRATMASLGYKRNEIDICVFNRNDSNGDSAPQQYTWTTY